MRKPVRFSLPDRFQRTCASSSTLAPTERHTSQLEIPFLLLLHRRNFVRSPQIARCRLSLKLRSGKDHARRTPSLFTEEYLHPGKLGKPTSDQMCFALD